MLHIAILFLIMMVSFRLRGDERVAGVMFGSLFIIHEVFLGSLSAPWYFATDAIMLCFAITMSRFFKCSGMILHIMILSFMLILLDFVGLLVWVMSLPLGIIDGCVFVLYSYICAIVIRGGENERISGLDYCMPLVFIRGA